MARLQLCHFRFGRGARARRPKPARAPRRSLRVPISPLAASRLFSPSPLRRSWGCHAPTPVFIMFTGSLACVPRPGARLPSRPLRRGWTKKNRDISPGVFLSFICTEPACFPRPDLRLRSRPPTMRWRRQRRRPGRRRAQRRRARCVLEGPARRNSARTDQTGCAATGPALYIYTPLETTRPVAPEASTRPDLLLLHDYTPLTHTSALRPDRLCRGRRAPLR